MRIAYRITVIWRDRDCDGYMTSGVVYAHLVFRKYFFFSVMLILFEEN